MALPGESSSFPPLDKCLSREHCLISWKTAYSGLTQLETSDHSATLQSFFLDPHSVRLLRRPLEPFEKPTTQTKSAFETKTAAINVTPSVDGHYDIEEIKDDAVWLSKETGIDELSALRVVVLEWQTRAAARLLVGFSEEEAVGLQDVARANGLGASFLGSQLSIPQAATADRNEFSLPISRQIRLIETYLAERRYILKVCEWLVCSFIEETTLATTLRTKTDGAGDANSRLSWMARAGRSILDGNGSAIGINSNKKALMLECISGLETRIDRLQQGSGYFESKGGREDFEEAWFESCILETIQIMQLLFVLSNSSTEITNSSVILAWFRFVSRYGFFEQFDVGYASTTALVLPFQSLVALVSLSLVKLPLALNHLLEPQDIPALVDVQVDETPYIINPAAIKELTEILLQVAGACLSAACPAVFAWGIVMQTLREVALTAKESRELRQSQRAVDDFVRRQSPETDGGDSSTTEDDSRGPPRRRTSTSSDGSLPTVMAEDILESVMDCTLDEDPIVYLAKSAVNGSHVFDVIISLATDFCPSFCTEHNGETGLKMRIELLDLIRASLVWIDYLPEVVLAALAVLTGAELYKETEPMATPSNTADPKLMFLEDELLMDKLFRIALTRFPYESLPFLKLCRALAGCPILSDEGMPLVSTSLQSIETFTHVLPSDFNAYQLIHEDENANYVALTRDLDIFPNIDSIHSRKLLELGQLQTGGTGSFSIPEGTNGRVLSESKPVVAIWTYQYSGFRYLGRILECFLTGGDQVNYVASGEVTRAVVVEIIGLFSTLLTTSVTNSGKEARVSGDAAQIILEEASDGLDRNGDIISVIFDIFEKDLQRQHTLSAVEGSLDLVVQCMLFVYSLVDIMPGRVWPLLVRSGLLEMDGKGGVLAALVTSYEIVSGHYSLLLTSVRLFHALVEDAVTQAIPRKGSTKVVARFAASNRLGTGLPDSVMRKVLLVFGRTMTDVFESSMNWKFVKIEEKLEVHTQILSLIDRVFLYCYGVDDNPDLSAKPVGVLAPLAEYLLDVLLCTSSNELSTQPLLRILADGIATPEPTLITRATGLRTLRVRTSLQVCASVIRLSILLQRPRSNLEQELFRTVAILVRLYVTHETYKVPLLSLFEALVKSAVTHDTEPPSLLGHLGSRAAKHFLDVLADLDKPLDSEALNISIWNLLSAVISNHQSWLATYLLTGATPRDSLKTLDHTVGGRSLRAKPLLDVALDSMANMQELRPRKALAILEFVALAEDYWPWVVKETHQYPEFLTAISDFIGGLESRISPSTQDKSLGDSEQLRMASYIAEILAMYLHHSSQSGDSSFAKRLVPKTSYFVDQAVKVPGYNASLHGNLRRNFEKKFAGCSLNNFKRTLLTRRQLGEDYFYDIEIAGKMLGFDPAWSGTRGQGFADELARANVNLSVVESQVNLLHSWKFLAIEMINALIPDEEFQRALVKTANDCLLSNTQSNLPENIFRHLMQVRADFAFVLMQRLIEVKSKEPEVKALLSTAWNTVRPSGANIELAVVGSEAEYNRSLLKVIFIALQFPLITSPSSPPTLTKGSLGSSTSQQSKSQVSADLTLVIFEILTILVLPGFRSLTTQLHDDFERSSSAAGDFILLTAILRTALRIPGAERYHSQIITHLADNQTARYATALFSWSVQLSVDGDPVYAELSILFLLELSSSPSLAEYLATESILTHLSNANIMNYFRRPNGSGPLEEPQRLHSTWSRGILPLCLNLVNGVGAQMAAEIAAFVNQFPNQLARAANGLDNRLPSEATEPSPSYITLALASEIHSLALIDRILDNYRAAGSSAGIVADEIAELRWDKGQVKEDLESWLQGRAALRERIIPTDEREGIWAREKPVRAASGAENRLEEKVVEEMSSALMCLGAGIT